ncbi:MAG: NAD(+)/NADH kinase [Bacteroidia bacterium]
MKYEQIILVRDKTRMERLVERFNTWSQARFYLERSGNNPQVYEEEHRVFYRSLEGLQQHMARRVRYKVLLREYLPSFLFAPDQLIVVLGQDGLVANTAKYAGQQPILGVNPDPHRYDGVLLPFATGNAMACLRDALDGLLPARNVSMAEARLRDGQRLLAFNDLFIGQAGHRSARYQIRFGQQREEQSSSGVLVATGVGSTGWLSSVWNMARSVHVFAGSEQLVSMPQMSWEQERLLFVVREPFLSRSSGIALTAGTICDAERLEIESYMPDQGVIFSDGIESDFLHFSAGAVASIGVASERAVLLQKPQSAPQRQAPTLSKRTKSPGSMR